MTDPRRQRFAPYFRRLADLMGLRDWEVAVDDAPPDQADALASIWCPPGKRFARVYLADEYLGDTPQEQREAAAHELIHCHFAAADYVAEGGLSESEWRAYRNAMEYGVDATARALAPLLPLPPDPESGWWPT